jgi:agmatinase
VPGGLSFGEAIYLVECVVRSGRRIIGFDVVEAVPRQGEPLDASVAARVLYKLCLLTLIS